MRLKRLELFGFKSFAERTVLDFETALNGIVGPNGCGKSNVVDAVRWVLGETRPTSMRGDEMADVIFKGSASRPPLSVAEVTMVLDNDRGVITERGPEVSVTRRVFKGGEGEYLIDGIKVRLKDVREMLFDTGLGSRGYSVLEQGRIDAVLSANPVDRRSIFEEAAGISRYRQRRKEAENRLKRVEADLVRLEDVVGELEKRSRSLKVQAGKARRFVEARDAWRVEGVRLARHQIWGLERDLTELAAEIASLEGRETALRAEREGAEGKVQEREREQEALSGEVERLAAGASELAGDVRALDERVTQLAARVTAWEASAVEEQERGRELEGRLGERREEARGLDEELAALDAEAAEAAERAEREAAAVRELQQRYGEARRSAEARGERVLELLHERTSARNTVEHLGQALAPLDERLERARERSAEAAANLAAAQATEAEAARAAQAAEVSLAEGQERRSNFEREADELEREVTRLDGERGTLELERTRLSSRVESLLDRERELEGLDAGARALMEGAEASDGPALVGALRGLVADHLRTDSEHARALDSVLGARAQAVVLADPADAVTVLAWLKERERGLVSLALPGALGRAAVETVPEEVLSRPGVSGVLRAAVEPAAGFEALCDVLLSGVVLVDDVETGLALVADFPALRFVTVGGDRIEAGGVVGGHREVAQGPVGRRSFAADLEAEVQRADGRIAELSATLEGVALAREEKRRDLDGLLEELASQRQRLAESRGAEEGARARAADLAEAAELFRREEQGIEEERRRLGTEEVEAQARLHRAEGAFEAENRALEEAEGLRSELEAKREELGRTESQARIEATRVAARIEAARGRQGDLKRQTAELEAELERARRLAQEHHSSSASGRRESEDLAERRVDLLERRGETEERLEALRGRERDGRAAIDELRRRSETVTRDLEAVLAEGGERRLAQQKATLERDEILRRVAEDFELTAYDLAQDFEPESDLDLPALTREVAELRAQMEKLGPVNMDAVTELEEVSGRLDFLTSQRDDLIAGRRTLESTIRTINQESERLFLETFDEIRGHFQTIFRQLFGGGRADVDLDPGAPVLEAGIEITARPPGRETLPISLLSGGQRTMTALALLFAVFRSRPSPFCVLDEVDAALDDANIARFLGLLDSFHADTQFLVVTHNKGTMSACDRLYGVTMAVRGVSNVVSVELSEVDEFVPEATGAAAATGPEPVVELQPQAAPPAAEERETGALSEASVPIPPGNTT